MIDVKPTNEKLRKRVRELEEENENLKKLQSPDVAYVRELEKRLKKEINAKSQKDCNYITWLECVNKSYKEEISELKEELKEKDKKIKTCQKYNDALLEEYINENDDEEIKKLKNIVLAYKTENNLLKSKLERLNNPKSLMELYYETIWQILS